MRYSLSFNSRTVVCKNFSSAIDAALALEKVQPELKTTISPAAWWGDVKALSNADADTLATIELDMYAFWRRSAEWWTPDRSDNTAQRKESLRKARAELDKVRKDPLQHTLMLLLEVSYKE